ncbi:MAG: GNAT family N-acetyltransferase, partial [Actinobacteria bacterium]|nr:GNAT family N-acetyltransferase [Actinomycetota bacterium]NIS35348.1 GNAT family N-acetyltransferase [Actinomycetota bacterium]NIT96835.1 GNAT family N-acetyltransferase [Actinomycetota bacterium]NIU21710.1 GNAT family N-acetyltransferase [Actinomycetota bacterium]NIU70048.1 GNAT family N-acetyltransferase [Actinomycetota bacterium]
DDARPGARGLSGSPPGDAGIRIRRIRPDEAHSLRAIRLRAVVDAPHAFSGTLAGTGARPPSVWEERARRGSAGDTEIVVFAERGSELVGMAGALTPHDEPRTRRVHGVWVDPSAREAGAGSGLV